MNIIRPTLAQVLELMGRTVVCRVAFDDGEMFDSSPSVVVGVVVAAPGSKVFNQILLHDPNLPLPPEGYGWEARLDLIKFLRVLDSDATVGLRLPDTAGASGVASEVCQS